jgi:23S rRNA (cytosine1962-C5)-methyltransferase
MESWDISPRGEKRFNEGHPWVFSNEITSPIKKIQPGDLVKLTNSKGRTLAVGYGNPHSLIAFRCLQRSEAATIDSAWFAAQLVKAARVRDQLQLTKYSHRLVFSEADQLPGLVIDCFKTPHSQQIFVIEILTAGMDRWLENLPQIFEMFLKSCTEHSFNYYAWAKTTLVVKRDNSFRKMENIDVREAEVFGELTSEQLKSISIITAQSLHPRDYVIFQTDLFEGQKTGFFLDQRSNVELLLKNLPKISSSPIRVLDLFCYVGQWSTQIAKHLKDQGATVEVTSVDSSQKALDFCAKNVAPYADRVTPLKMDIVDKCMELIPPQTYDIVVCDPPALIKAKKDFEAGKFAYTKVNSAAMRALKPGGMMISCSCSQHLSDVDLTEVLTASALKSHKKMLWLAKGQQAADHPMLMEFPQGTYLNSWLGLAKADLE